MDRVKESLIGFGKYMKERAKKASPVMWIGWVCMFIVGLLCFLMAVMWSVDLASGIPFFTEAGENGEIGPAMTSYEIAAVIVFYILGLGCLAMTVYEVFFRPIETKKAGHRDIIHGAVVDLDKTYSEQDQEEKKK